MEEEASVMQDRPPRCAVCRVSARSRRLFLFAAARVGRSGEEGIMGDGVRWREVTAGESPSASQWRRVGRGCQAQIYAQVHGDHCVQIRKARLTKLSGGFFLPCFTIVNEQSTSKRRQSAR